LRWDSTEQLQKEKCAYMIQPTELGFRIASKRRARGLTQGQVAIHMGVSPQAVSKWERGLACPDLVFLDDLADLLDVSIEELLLGRPSVALASA
jgi:transcriptional regulator with XRE-family HTH domain